jgi:thiamine-monophosphate kinase
MRFGLQSVSTGLPVEKVIMAANENRPGEDALIERYFAPLAGAGGLNLRDDAALLAIDEGSELVTTVDMLVSGVHFFADDPPDAIAIKALGVNLSDLAAKGARPLGFLLALALPEGWTEEWLASFSRGLGEAARHAQCPLLGGDTTRAAGPLVISITAFGEVPKGRMVPRTGAQAGDIIAVSGTIGDAALGLKIRSTPEAEWVEDLAEKEFAFLLDRYLRPIPRLALADALRHYAHAAMDVSDGLIGDCAKMMRVSGVTGSLTVDEVPFSSATQKAVTLHPELLANAVTGGDDYEILLTLSPDRWEALQKAARSARISITKIGLVSAGTAPLSVTYRGGPFVPASASYSHF